MIRKQRPNIPSAPEMAKRETKGPENRQMPPPRPSQGRPARIRLPFEKRNVDAGTWAYEHKVGLCVTVIAYLLIGIAFISTKIIIAHPNYSDTIYIDMENFPDIPEQQELTPELREMLEDQLRNARNAISNENARETAERYETSGQDIPQDIAQRAEQVQESMRESRETYERGLQEERDMIEASRNERNQNRNNNDNTQDVKVTGNVIISFSLEGRSAVYMHKPAYQCEGGGEVIVNITVNRNGHVTGASIAASSTRESCIVDRALEAAKLSRFNVDGSAPERQQGTITYLFVPQ